ncbi:MAG TPA: HAMP domain-containing sensor histidine kinase [Actinopolymorphaceae bacterium]|nr:HAMP domain-containing sensor histidine kinase [Actinopolymorphaceae bacterium]
MNATSAATEGRAPSGGHRWSLRFRLVVALVAAAAVGLAIVGTASVVLLRHSLIARVDEQLGSLNPKRITAVLALQGGLRPGPDRGPGLPSDFRATLLQRDGTTIGTYGQSPDDTTGPVLPVLDQSSVAERSATPFTVSDESGHGAWRIRVMPVRAGRSVAVAQSLATVDATVDRLFRIEIAVGALVLALLGFVAAAVVRIGLRPLTRIEQTAAAIAAGDLDRRVTGYDPHTETGRLAQAFNTMLGRLAGAFRQREESEHRLRHFVADASHELRTPLTSIRGFAELYRRGGAQQPEDVDKMMARIESEATRMGLLVDDLLMLARLDHERPLDLSEVDLVTLAKDAVDDAQAHDPGRRVRLAVGSEPVRVLGDEHRLRQVVANLVTNAVQHTPPGCPVQLFVGWARPDDPSPPADGAAGAALPAGVQVAVIEVADSGPGVPLDKAPHVFGRLYRGDPGSARSGGHRGTGLGLAIVAAILAAHQGRVELRTEPGRGARFRILLPGARVPGPSGLGVAAVS